MNQHCLTVVPNKRRFQLSLSFYQMCPRKSDSKCSFPFISVQTNEQQIGCSHCPINNNGIPSATRSSVCSKVKIMNVSTTPEKEPRIRLFKSSPSSSGAALSEALRVVREIAFLVCAHSCLSRDLPTFLAPPLLEFPLLHLMRHRL